ncbi:PilT/PilU family type 4a pilus ATPase [Patescibacteria group bacterium]|nr:PilT/PilU family type 4a pilus ATPase [Patescibacteria group bacterium]MDE1946757.1 PilT/PilU family type 4a pilus ATPase [Patescibacteria group bacterium]MDE2010940.1 PilT/PilU family type 4a pilus ATPase [Patescibacteria group bacterium]MDE2233655.1 PilT/PilU family type 4a pilus ATPase [Patescibacteria group bacterium]
MDYKKELDDLVNLIIKEGASDLHLSPGRPPIIRSAGNLIPLVRKAVLSEADMKGFLGVLLTAPNKELLEKDKNVDFSYNLTHARFRGNAYFRQGAAAVALRLIPKAIRTLSELNLPPILESFTRKPQGFFLVVGPIGQGKTTTLSTLIEIINQTRNEHILTIEDPIEYQFDSKKSIIDQREVRLDTPDFRDALTAMFREDVDVCMVGEMRDTDTMATAVTAAETGHLIFSTLHTNNAAQTVNRIIDSFASSQQDQIRIQLAGSLTGIFSQRLIPRISGGLIPAYELLINNSAVSNLIREKRVHEIQTVVETSSQEGMVDMNRSLAELVRAGEITVESAYLNSLSPKALERMI